MYSILILGLCSFVLSFLLTPLFRNLFLRIGCVDHPDHDRKRHEHAVPRIGGIPIVLSCLGAVGIFILLPLQGAHLLASALPLMWKLFPATLVVFLTGTLDDIVGLRPWQKLGGQAAAAALASWAGVHVSFLGNELHGWFAFVVTVFWLIICTNAFNLIDGVDGLAAGVGLFATLTTLIAALLNGSFTLAIAVVPLAGALLGFLRYNFNPASIFLGDCGSLTVGFLLGCYGVIWSQKSATTLGMTAPLLALSIPLLDTGLAIVRRLLRGQDIFHGDRRHIHHILLDRGLAPRRVVLLLYCACGLVAVLSLLQNTLHTSYTGLILLLFCAAAWIGIQHLGYIEFGLASRLIVPATFQRVLNSQLRLRRLEDALTNAETPEECWTAIRSASMDLGFTRLTARLDHTLFDEQFVPPPDTGNAASACWNLDVPLSSDEFVRLFREFETELSPMVIAPLADVLRRTLEPKLPGFRKAVHQETP